MGEIGPRQQRFEVLPAPRWDVEDLLIAWQAEAPLESGVPDGQTDLATSRLDER